MLVFKGLQKTTLIDFPGKVACTLFLPKCNFRCPFCYNRQLVLGQKTGLELDENEAIRFLRERKGFLDGICISGGEPLLHDLAPFLQKAKGLGLLVKIDTNGSKPAALKSLAGNGLVDYVAMDIKASGQNYEKAAGTKVDLDAIDKSASFLKNGLVEYEFRCTVVPGIHSREDMLGIGRWLSGAKRFFIQQFNPNVPLLDTAFEKVKPFSPKELKEFAELLGDFFGEVKVRSI